jgi:hypothetical protein
VEATRQDPQIPQASSAAQQEQSNAETNGDLIDLEPGPVASPAATSAREQGVPAVQKNPSGAPKSAKLDDRTNLEMLADGVQKVDLQGPGGGHGGRSDSPGLRRLDSETRTLDEFHDAES